MIEPNNPILSKMLDRLFAAMLNGPSMNCRPHASRQRLDLVQLAKLKDVAPGEVLLALLGKDPTIKLAARVPIPARKPAHSEDGQHNELDEAQAAWADQQFIRTKMRVIAEDVRTYEQDTGVHALNVGFPLLSLPPGTFGGRFGIAPSRRVLAPIAFIPLTLTVKTGAQQAVEMTRREGADAIVPNQALLAWLEKLDIHHCYLDVHYRSRHADLIGFSNEQFYGSRLQAIPEHPRSRTRHAPLTLVRADGFYEKRRNEAEADAVVKIVKDLLKRPQPPSVGIACFNLPQRDLIVEKLEEAAEDDGNFAAALAEARMRRGDGSSEGLFVKNLENVQGDERDHLIISTTYGPDRSGKFRRNFGPVGKPGGGRRLNVLVTRAREQLHIVTSIPRSEYATLPPIPQGQSASGTWLLFAYLNHCERLAEDYETAWRILKNAKADESAQVNVRPSKTPSQFAKALAGRLVTSHNVGSDLHWGNDGFCVDLALHHPERAEDVSIAVLADTTRYATDDPVEWEVFRTHMLQQQGWKVHRIWTPHFFRDPSGCMNAILRDIDAALEQEREQSSRAVETTTGSNSTGSSVRDVIKRRSRKDADNNKNAA